MKDTFKVIRVLTTIIDTIYDAIDVLVASSDFDEEREDE